MNHDLINAQRQLKQLRQRQGIQYRPRIELPERVDLPLPLPIDDSAPGLPATAIDPPAIVELSHHGDIAIAAMRAGQACHYQLWLALRLLDAAGSGRVEIGAARERFTKEDSGAFLYKWPRLKQVLAEGNGRFWHYDDEYIWMRGTVSLASELGVSWLNGRFGAISADVVTGRTVAFRAHCYAAWLSNHGNPISQATIERLTGIPPRTQRRYCRLADIRVQQNISIGPPASAADGQVCAWQHGNTFEFCDFRGMQGPAFRRYISWHLPASYDIGSSRGGRSQQRRLNRELAQSLAITAKPGNQRLYAGRVFFENGAAAARQMSGVPATDAYWWQRRAKSGTGIWNVMSGHLVGDH